MTLPCPPTGIEDLSIEACAVRSWPAVEVGRTGGWLLRATPGVRRRRSNSAVPPLNEAIEGIDAVEDFYRCRGADVLVQVSPAHRHEHLDAHLAARGYRLEGATLVMRAPLPARSCGEDSPWQVRTGPRDRQWTELAGGERGDPALSLVVDRIPGRTTFARVVDGGRAVGVGAGVVDDGRLGVFAMGTAPGHRRCGIADAVLSRLLEWGGRSGADSAWLQVEENNTGARRLYERHGFVLSHRYHYRRCDRQEIPR